MKGYAFLGNVLLVSAFFFLLFPFFASAATYYVAKAGNDANAGTEASPWLTITKAANTLVAGDTVYVKAGTYKESAVVKNSGSAGKWIAFAAYPNNAVTLDGTGLALPNWHGMFHIDGRNYINISGFRIIHAPQAGITADRADRIVLENNYIYDVFLSPIKIGWGSSSNIIIDGNTIDRPWRSDWGETTFPGWQEAISVSNASTVEVRNNVILQNAKGEGIDLKDGTTNGKVYNNVVQNTSAAGIYLDGWAGYNRNIDVFSNVVYSISASGIVVNAGECGGRSENIRIYNNILYNNLQGGIFFSNYSSCSVPSGILKNVTVVNNIIYNNGRAPNNGVGGIFVWDNSAQGITIRNNIVSKNKDFQIVTGSAGTTIDYNLIDGYKGTYDWAGYKETKGTNYIEADPKFVNPAINDFRHQSTSPAIDRGSSAGAPNIDFDGNPRPQGSGYDLGAYEYVSSPPSQSTNLVANPGFESGSGTPTNWSLVTNSGNTPIWDTVARSGLRSIRIQIAGTSDAVSGQPQSDFIGTRPGVNYTFSAWGRTENAGGTYEPAVRAAEYDANKNWLRQTNLVFSKGTNPWSQKQTSFQTGPDASYLLVYANLWNGYGTFWVDDVEITITEPQVLDMSPVYQGAWIKDVHWNITKLPEFESHAEKGVSILHFYQAWGAPAASDRNFPTALMDTVRNHGSIPMISWAPEDWTKGASQPDYSLRNIINGNFDAYITQWARDAKAWGRPFFLRFAWEMNGDWYPWSEKVNGNSPGEFVHAWRHVRDIFTANGVNTVTWVWSPNIEDSLTIPLENIYPGDAYVDWVAMDGYNWGTTQSWSSWQTFSQIFDATYLHLLNLAPSKPIMIAETGSAEAGGSKANWINDVYQTQLPARYPKIKAIVWFNENKESDWRIESSSAAQNAYANSIASGKYVSNNYAGLNASPIPPPQGASCIPNWQCESPLNGYESDGCGSRRANAACSPFDFSLSISPSGGSVNQGISISTRATAALVSGSAQPVSFSCSGLPSGSDCFITPPSVNPTESSTITISTLSSTPAGTYPITVIAAGGGMARTATFTLAVDAPASAGSLGEAVDNTALAWTTGGNAEWFGQSGAYYYGGDAAQSGKIGDSQQTWVQTTVKGPGTLRFYWKVSSEKYYDYLNFYIDGSLKSQINGERSWAQKSYIIRSGTHALKWAYVKNNNRASGGDAGWLDRVEYSGSASSITGRVLQNVAGVFSAFA